MPNRYGAKAQEKVHTALHELKEGKLKSGSTGKPVKSRKQAIAIGLSEARKEGGKVPSKRASKKTASH
ncbi:DUF6496 domain-containing protein [Ideonella azotifigens]|uniref:DUF6496 domain-containing protein n=1 Tax=Ideonella azotifigens TaxID=513160 RepID=A0ABN1JZA6_9BURK|nr:DUF6496 domain-containing protein [Ideonella azotifigens]MCD2342760.1 DUF6496 domain-containing protein [Ideonella azotifigens]